MAVAIYLDESDYYYENGVPMEVILFNLGKIPDFVKAASTHDDFIQGVRDAYKFKTKKWKNVTICEATGALLFEDDPDMLPIACVTLTQEPYKCVYVYLQGIVAILDGSTSYITRMD